MAKRINASRVTLDWRRLLGFDQATGADGGTSAATLSPKIGPKDARGFSDYSTLGAKIGPKEARGLSLGRNLDAKVGEKNPDVVPSAMAAKIGFKDN